MAREFTINASLGYEDDEGSEELMQVVDFIASIATKKFSKFKINVGLTEEAIPLAEVTTIGWLILINQDETNFVSVRKATAETPFGKLAAGGGFCILQGGSGLTAPYLIADTAACQVTGLLFST